MSCDDECSFIYTAMWQNFSVGFFVELKLEDKDYVCH